jgi:hypothetical protein
MKLVHQIFSTENLHFSRKTKTVAVCVQKYVIVTIDANRLVAYWQSQNHNATTRHAKLVNPVP